MRLEKPRGSSNSGEQGHAYRERRGPKPTRRQAYRFETAGPSWNGPLLLPAYAAQVIAQALPASDPPSARNAYARARIPAALFCDETL